MTFIYFRLLPSIFINRLVKSLFYSGDTLKLIFTEVLIILVTSKVRLRERGYFSIVFLIKIYRG